jgi:hypothetical protein
MGEVVAAEFEEAAKNVLEDEGAVIADVGVVVDGGAAGVHGDLAGSLWEEEFELIGEGVVEAYFVGREHFSA